VASHRLGTRPEGNDALEVFCLVILVGDLAAVPVQLALRGSPAGGVPRGDDAMDAIEGEEAQRLTAISW
jgi:hypothetical protein